MFKSCHKMITRSLIIFNHKNVGESHPLHFSFKLIVKSDSIIQVWQVSVRTSQVFRRCIHNFCLQLAKIVIFSVQGTLFYGKQYILKTAKGCDGGMPPNRMPPDRMPPSKCHLPKYRLPKCRKQGLSQVRGKS